MREPNCGLSKAKCKSGICPVTGRRAAEAARRREAERVASEAALSEFLAADMVEADPWSYIEGKKALGVAGWRCYLVFVKYSERISRRPVLQPAVYLSARRSKRRKLRRRGGTAQSAENPEFAALPTPVRPHHCDRIF